MKIVVIDGQGGRMGAAIIQQVRAKYSDAKIIAVGTNSAATGAMLGAKPTAGATGENAVIVNCRDADYVIGPIGILMADALYGEISPAMAVAVGQSPGRKLFLPMNNCNAYVAGVQEQPLNEYIKALIDIID